MRYISKNQVVEFIIEELSKTAREKVGKQWVVYFYLKNRDVISNTTHVFSLFKHFGDTKAECIALAEKTTINFNRLI